MLKKREGGRTLKRGAGASRQDGRGRAPLRRGRAWLPLAAALGCAVLLAGCQSASPANTDNGTALYAQNCAGCHGANGTEGVAPPLDDSLFLQLASDQDLRQTIDAGRPEYLMPAFGQDHRGSLSSAQIDALVAWMRSQWQPGGATPTPTPAAGAVTLAAGPPGDAARGRTLFATACASCHGQGGGGGSGGAIDNPTYLALTSNAELRRIIITGLPDRKMPAYNQLATTLSNQDISDLVAYLAGLRPPAASPTPSP